MQSVKITITAGWLRHSAAMETPADNDASARQNISVPPMVSAETTPVGVVTTPNANGRADASSGLFEQSSSVMHRADLGKQCLALEKERKFRAKQPRTF